MFFRFFLPCREMVSFYVRTFSDRVEGPLGVKFSQGQRHF